MLKPIYAVVASGLLGLYISATFLGWEAGGFGRESASQAAARQSSGGHRSHASTWFWTTSYRGGK
ncbi:MAG TPA: hypothetical protein VKE74_07360 [Gemmataceae bacterium]|nr:hypothetical protein [Gemmataceae bacterium]